MQDRFDIIKNDNPCGCGGLLSNADGEAVPGGTSNVKIPKEVVEQGLDVVSTLMQNIIAKKQDETRQKIKAVCGRKPLFNRTNRLRYQKCVEDLNKPIPEPYRSSGDNTTTWIIVGTSVVVLAIVGAIVISKSKVQPATVLAQNVKT